MQDGLEVDENEMEHDEK